MKKFIALILISFTFSSCTELLLNEALETRYYLSVKITYEESIAGISGVMVGDWANKYVEVYKNGTLFSSFFTGNDGWLVTSSSYKLTDMIQIKFINPRSRDEILASSFSPSTHSNFFVINQKDARSNIPPEGYHFHLHWN
jgi:hypothetical protein